MKYDIQLYILFCYLDACGPFIRTRIAKRNNFGDYKTFRIKVFIQDMYYLSNYVCMLTFSYRLCIKQEVKTFYPFSVGSKVMTTIKKIKSQFYVNERRIDG